MQECIKTAMCLRIFNICLEIDAQSIENCPLPSLQKRCSQNKQEITKLSISNARRGTTTPWSKQLLNILTFKERMRRWLIKMSNSVYFLICLHVASCENNTQSTISMVDFDRVHDENWWWIGFPFSKQEF
jgi:hypothetical protein